MVDVLRQLQQVPAARQPRRRHRRDWSAATAGSGCERDGEQLRLVCARHGRCWRSWPASRRCASTSASGSTTDELRRRAGPPRRPQAGADRASATRPRTWPATPRARRCRSSLRDGRPQRAAVPRPRLPARGGRRLLRRRRRPRRQRRHRPAVRRGQDHRRHRRHGRCCRRSTLVLTTSITAVKQWRREILDKTDLDRGPGRRVHRRVARRSPR